MLCGVSGVFIGQHESGQPNGFIIFISEDRIFEGYAIKSNMSGWGRLIVMNRCDIGWWGGNCLQGYCRTYEYSELKKQGWYQNSVQKDTLEYNATAYPYWEAKEEYF